jgi:hypothetical protein
MLPGVQHQGNHECDIYVFFRLLRPAPRTMLANNLLRYTGLPGDRSLLFTTYEAR